MGKGKKSGTERTGQLFLTLFRTCTRINPRPTQPHHPPPSLLPPHPFGRIISSPEKRTGSRGLSQRGEVRLCCGLRGSSTDARVELRRSTPPPAESERRRDLEIPKRPEPRYAVLPLFLYLLYLSLLYLADRTVSDLACSCAMPSSTPFTTHTRVCATHYHIFYSSTPLNKILS